MNLIEYIPPFLRGIKEFKEIFNTEDVELAKLRESIEKISKEVIVKTAESYGLDRYEKIYNIIPKSNTNVEERRFNILSRINDKIPFSLNWLNNKLETLVGENNYKISVDYNEYQVTIEIILLFEDIANTLNQNLRKQLPANMVITVNVFQTEQLNQYYGFVVQEADYIKIKGGNVIV